MIGAVLPWLSLALLIVATASAIGAIASRSLFVACVYLTTTGVCVAAMALISGDGEGGLALGLFAAGVVPGFLLAAMLLSGRTSKASAGRAPWLSVAVAGVAAAATWWPLLELSGHAPMPGVASAMTGLGFWLAPLMLVVAAACVGALGYGERGAFVRGDEQ